MDTTAAFVKDTIVKVIKSQENLDVIPVNNICCNPILLLTIIIITGIIGGLINYLLNASIKQNNDNSESIFKTEQFYLQILLGICGAALIPLLLYLTSSKLFEKCDNCYFTYFVFTGYCFVGAIFSKALLNSLAQRLDIEKLKEKIREDVKHEVDKKIIEKEREEEEQEGSNEPGDMYEDPTPIKEEIEKSKDILETDINNYIKDKADYEMETILNDLQTSKYKDRSIKGISRKTKIHENNVLVIMNAFKKAGIVITVQWYGKVFYTLTEKGKHIKLVK